MKTAALLPALLLLASCVDTINETRGEFTDRGRTYPTVTREFQREDGSTYSRMTIFVGAERVSCIPGDVGDCRVALSDIRVRSR